MSKVEGIPTINPEDLKKDVENTIENLKLTPEETEEILDKAKRDIIALPEEQQSSYKIALLESALIAKQERERKRLGLKSKEEPKEVWTKERMAEELENQRLAREGAKKQRESDLAEAEEITKRLKAPEMADEQGVEAETRQLAEDFLEKTKKLVNDQGGIKYRIKGSTNMVDNLIVDLNAIRDAIVDDKGEIIPAQVELRKGDMTKKMRMIDAIEEKFQKALSAQ